MIKLSQCEYMFPLGNSTAIAKTLAANKGNSHLFDARRWKHYRAFTGPSINILYRKYSTVMEVNKLLGDTMLVAIQVI